MSEPLRSNDHSYRRRASRYRALLLALLASFALVAAACGDSSGDETSTSSDASAESDGDAESSDEEGAAPNSCPSDGCSITIDSVSVAGSELEVDWSTNFTAAFEQNHIHVYWDTFSAAQVSSDAGENGLEQGTWHPTGAADPYTTQGDSSVAVRGESTTLCVTAANRDHAVLDTDLVHCMDVSEQLSGL